MQLVVGVVVVVVVVVAVVVLFLSLTSGFPGTHNICVVASSRTSSETYILVFAADTDVATLTCTDIDASPNGDITTYTVVSGDDASAKFKTVGAVVRTTAVVLDYETKISYTLLVDVVDGGASPQTGTATIVVVVRQTLS